MYLFLMYLFVMYLFVMYLFVMYLFVMYLFVMYLFVMYLFVMYLFVMYLFVMNLFVIYPSPQLFPVVVDSGDARRVASLPVSSRYLHASRSQDARVVLAHSATSRSSRDHHRVSQAAGWASVVGRSAVRIPERV